MKSIKKQMRWIIGGIAAILFIIICICVLKEDIERFDQKVYAELTEQMSEETTILVKGVTTLGSAIVIVPVCLITSMVFAYHKKPDWKYIILNLVIVVVANQLIKIMIERPRPDINQLVQEAGYSFPSGHTMVSTAFYGFFIYLIVKKVKNPYYKWISVTLLSILIIAIGTSRIYLGVHFASDVVAGFCLSIAYLSVFTASIAKQIEEREEA